MLLLAIDTSANSGSIALERDGKIIFVYYTDIQITHSERLMPQIEQAFKVNNLTAKDLDAVLLSNGPGSFTGIRIGLATAKGICYAHQIPLIPFNTLEMHAVNAVGRNHPVLSVIDAKMNEVYVSLYDADLNELLPPQSCSTDKLVNDLLAQEIKQVIMCGDIMPELTSKLAENQISVHLLPAHQNLNIVTSLFTLRELKQIDPVWDQIAFSDLEPYYVRSSLAQIKQNKK